MLSILVGGNNAAFQVPVKKCRKLGTPHTYHYQNSKDAILAKKHVLCEKPVTSNAAELKSLLVLAKENGVFFMEAMWTRFQPLSHAFKAVLEDGRLGPPVTLHADLSGYFDIESEFVIRRRFSHDCLTGRRDLPTTHRILDPRLGGGALLDLYVFLRYDKWVSHRKLNGPPS